MTFEQGIFWAFFPLWLGVVIVAAIIGALIHRIPWRGPIIAALCLVASSTLAAVMFHWLWRFLLQAEAVERVPFQIVEVTQQVAVAVLVFAGTYLSLGLERVLRDGLPCIVSLGRNSRVFRYVHGVASVQPDDSAVE